MKNFSVVLISLYAILTITVANVSCQIEKYDCMAYNEYGCKTDMDCCTKNCVHGYKLLMGTCDTPKGALEAVNNKRNGVLGPHGVCVYIRESNANLRDYYYKKFSVHAANAKLPANSVFAIYANDATVEVTMSDDQSKTSKFDAGFTFLSEEAAEALGITEDGTKIDCKILSPYRRKFVTFLAHAYYYFALITPVVGVVGIVVSALMKYVATI